jgi:hypothetical protein
MKEELQKKLYEKYPKIFSQKDLPMSETCMCWGICHDDGWYNILDTLCASIQHHIDYENCDGKYESMRKHRPLPSDGTWVQVHQVEATQVKEKFGGLRFYYNGGDEFINGLVTFAQSISLRTCETCGAPGRPTKKGWIRTMCKPCADAAQKELMGEFDDKEGE